MNDHEYRTLPAYANSDLSELFNLRTGNLNKPIDPKAARFGTTFHSMILEPQKPIDWSIHHVTEHDAINKMRDSFNVFWADCFPAWDIRANVEVVRQWVCPVTGLPLKAKLDSLIVRNTQPSYAIDLKTTSCGSPDEFMESIHKYGYDRQAAFYLDAIGSTSKQPPFLFVAVQKRIPYTVFAVDMFRRSDMIDNARLKNARLLRDALAESQKVGKWLASFELES